MKKLFMIFFAFSFFAFVGCDSPSSEAEDVSEEMEDVAEEREELQDEVQEYEEEMVEGTDTTVVQ